MTRAKDSCPSCGERVFVSDETFAISPHNPDQSIFASGWVNTCKNCGTTSVHQENEKENKQPTADEEKIIGRARAEINKVKAQAKKDFKASPEYKELKKSKRYKERLKQNPEHEEAVLRTVSAKMTQDIRYKGVWQ